MNFRLAKENQKKSISKTIKTGIAIIRERDNPKTITRSGFMVKHKQRPEVFYNERCSLWKKKKTSLKRDSYTSAFLWICETFKNSFLQNTSGWLLLETAGTFSTGLMLISREDIMQWTILVVTKIREIFMIPSWWL